MLRSMPVASIVMSSAEPPNEMNGSGSPLVGKSPVTTPRFTIVCVARSTVIPSARYAPKASGARSPIRSPREVLDRAAGEIEEPEGEHDQCHAVAEVGLHEHERRQHASHEQRRQRAGAEVVQLAAFSREKRREIDDERELRQLHRLEGDR